MKTTLLKSLLLILVFTFAFYGKKIFAEYIPISFSNNWLKILYYYSWWLIPPVFYMGLSLGFKNILPSTGLKNGFIKGLLFAFVSVSPMFISSAFIGNINHEQSLVSLLHSTVFAGFMEEFLFRGFLFGILFRFCGWGFIPAGILGAIIFGLGHIYQGHDLMSIIAVFFVTTIGALWFSWLYAEWNYNLWLPVFLHVFMNLSWSLFQLDENAVGGLYSNIFRGLTIAITVIVTIRFKKKAGFAVNKSNLWKNLNTSG
jgi:membrane protease YdiL (CAAX protease family)